MIDFIDGEEVIVELDDEDNRREIREEQAEQVEKLEALLVEFEKKYDEFAVPLGEFFDGYWNERMTEVLKEKVPINHEALKSIGVTLRETSRAYSQSYMYRKKRVEEVNYDDSDD